MTITFPEKPLSAPGLSKTTGAGAEQWHDRNDVNIPVQGINTTRTNVYWRRNFMSICTATRKQYNWAWLDARFAEASTKRQKIAFGFMDLYPEGNAEHGLVQYDGAWASYPKFLNDAMLASNLKPYKKQYDGSAAWVPNYNNPLFWEWRLEVLTDIRNHIIEKGWGKMISYMDIRYGSWGEWHFVNVIDNFSEMPADMKPTSASLKRLIDDYCTAFPNWPLVVPFAAYDCDRLNHTKTPVDVGYYALTRNNQWGPIGWRRDNWGITDGYTVFYTKDNNYVYNGVRLGDLIMARYKTSPVVGEPPGWNISYSLLESQIREYHATSFGNGNYAGADTNSQNRDFIRAASKAAGYRIMMLKADVSNVGKKITAKLEWYNKGICPPYDDWNIEFSLWKGGVGTKVYVSTFKLKGFQPTGAVTVAVDTFTPVIPDGSYELRFAVVDKEGYAWPMELAMDTTQAADGSYSLGTLTLTGDNPPEPPVNQKPVVSAGPDRRLKLPANTTTLVGSASDPDGTIPAGGILWEYVSGPAGWTLVTPKSLTTTARFTQSGVYTFRLTATDNLGATSTDEVVVTVEAEVTQPPVQRRVVLSRLTYNDNTTEDFIPKV